MSVAMWVNVSHQGGMKRIGNGIHQIMQCTIKFPGSFRSFLLWTYAWEEQQLSTRIVHEALETPTLIEWFYKSIGLSALEP